MKFQHGPHGYQHFITKIIKIILKFNKSVDSGEKKCLRCNFEFASSVSLEND